MARRKKLAVERNVRWDSFDSPEGRTQHCPACEAGAHVCGRLEDTGINLLRDLYNMQMSSGADVVLSGLELEMLMNRHDPERIAHRRN